MLSPDYDGKRPKPLPIDWEVPTHGCELAIRGTGHEIGYLNIKDARIRDFLQPAIFPEDIEIWPPGSRSEIAWLHFKGDPQKEPSKEHPFEYDPDDWENPNNLYNIDLLVAKEETLEFVQNVMPPTNSKVFWDSMGPFGKFDGVHEISAWQFSSNKSCKYYFLGAMAFIWDVPTELDPLPTYRLRFTISSDATEERISGPFRIQAHASGPLHRQSPPKAVLGILGKWMVYAYAFVALTILGLLVASMLLGRQQRQGLIRLEEADREI